MLSNVTGISLKYRLLRSDLSSLGGVVIFRSIDNPTPSQLTMVRPANDFCFEESPTTKELGNFS